MAGDGQYSDFIGLQCNRASKNGESGKLLVHEMAVVWEVMVGGSTAPEGKNSLMPRLVGTEAVTILHSLRVGREDGCFH